jgi:hypothetical protein
MPQNKSKYIYTGKKDALGRMVFRGPRGGIFVRGPSGKKVKPATGNSRAKSPMRRR